MTLDILFLAKNRLEFTRESLAALLANTNWSLVRNLELLDDGSVDGACELLMSFRHETEIAGVNVNLTYRCNTGSPAALMNLYAKGLSHYTGAADIFAKIDNDVIVPPGWLDACVEVMESRPELDLLGIEPPASRTPHFADGQRKPAPEDAWRASLVFPNAPVWPHGYAPCDSIGGIGLMRTRCFQENEPLRPHSIYGGFTEWQVAHPRVKKGWIVPPLKVFLLDRMPAGIGPWAELSKEYESKGWQRPWSKYDVRDAEKLWGWWTPVGVSGVAAAPAPGVR